MSKAGSVDIILLINEQTTFSPYKLWIGHTAMDVG